MVRAFRVKWASASKKVFVGEPEFIFLEPEFILTHRLREPSFINSLENLTATYRINGRTIKGVAISNDEFELEKFTRSHAYHSRTSPRVHGFTFNSPRRIFRWKGHVFTFNGDIQQVTVAGKTYLLEEAEFIMLLGWEEKEGKIFSLLCGACISPRAFFYYSGTACSGTYVKFVNRLDLLPPRILKGLSKNFRIFPQGERSGLRWEGNINPLIDVLPHPPVEALCAIKLAPPEKIERTEPAGLPPSLRDVFLLRTFIYTEKGIPLKKLSPGQMRAFAQHVHGDIFDAEVKNEDALSEYRSLYESSSGYVVLCRPSLRLG